MKVKGYKLLQYNGIDWQVFPLAEHVILLECSKDVPIEIIHQSTHRIIDLLSDQVEDIVPSYHSIAIFTQLSIRDLIEKLSDQFAGTNQQSNSKKVMKLPICYEFGLDLKRVSEKTQLSEEHIIERHLNRIYRAIFIGFTPGFVYADGLDTSLACERLSNPRKMVEAGSIGIGGNQTGIYSLGSPGGWNIIGRTPATLFDKTKQPPMKLDVGGQYQFFRITQEEFEQWEN
ncbi:MAG: 5-oxoprolinase subunit PxpB [Bacteroidota bacterium]